MTLNTRGVLVISGAILVATACARAQPSRATSSPTILTQTENGLEMQLVAAYRDGENIWITLCYEQPSGKNWIPGRHTDDLSISVAGNSYRMSSLELIGFQSSQDGHTTHRCDRFYFNVPDQPQDGVYHLIVEHLVGKTATSDDCPEVQQRLEADKTGIRIECLLNAEGFFSFGLIERPDDMTDLEASYVVDDLAGEVVAGPWEFSFTIAALGE
ncbi:MAG: hypothetical protein IIA51_08475 [Chloroflexi bacterium]|nr:hypothetical protein [Chloroflexota bacterium]